MDAPKELHFSAEQCAVLSAALEELQQATPPEYEEIAEACKELFVLALSDAARSGQPFGRERHARLRLWVYMFRSLLLEGLDPLFGLDKRCGDDADNGPSCLLPDAMQAPMNRLLGLILGSYLRVENAEYPLQNGSVVHVVGKWPTRFWWGYGWVTDVVRKNKGSIPQAWEGGSEYQYWGAPARIEGVLTGLVEAERSIREHALRVNPLLPTEPCVGPQRMFVPIWSLSWSLPWENGVPFITPVYPKKLEKIGNARHRIASLLGVALPAVSTYAQGVEAIQALLSRKESI